VEWRRARRLLILAFFVLDALLLFLRFGPGGALVPSLRGPVDLASLVATDGLDLNAPSFRTKVSLPVLRVSTYPSVAILTQVLGFLPVESADGVYKGRDFYARVFPDGTVLVRLRAPAGSPSPMSIAQAARILRRKLSEWGLGVVFGSPTIRLTLMGGFTAYLPELSRPGGSPLFGAGAHLTFAPGGILKEARLRLVEVVGARPPSTPLIPGAAAIVTWAEASHERHPLVVAQVRLGYYLAPGAKGRSFELDPTWLVTLKSGRTVGIDALTEEVED